jgi:DNA mismatch repair protein MutS2
MNRHALGVLEFDKVVQMLVERTSFPPGAEQAGRLAPTVHVPTIKEELELVTEARGVLDEGGTLPPRDPRDVRPAVGRATVEGAALTCEELVDVARTLASIADARSVCSARRDERPRLWRLADGLTPHDDIADAIGGAIDEVAGEVRDSASRELAKIRRAIGTTRSRIDEKLRSILQKELKGDSIQEHAVHIRNGRHVLPVKQSARGKFKGIVHDQSSSGATVFIEPLATVSLNNELSDLAAGEKKEVARILRALTARVGECAGDIETSLAILARLDVVRAAARLSKDLDAVEPKLNDQGRLGIRHGRHPVLVEAVGGAGGEVVPLDLGLGDGATTLVISGPNAGGKTVALKTIGLLTLMAQSGLHVPAAPDSELAVFRDVFADIGDEQSIEQSLSTFSSHLKVIGEILEEATADTLVLIDEMGAGTDPDEGASLAIAILEDLTDRRAPTIATTHLGSVKSHVHNHGGMLNGSMAFDPDTLEPSFRFVPGIPGASHALQIADSLGLPDPVLSRARELRHEDAAKVDDLLADLAERERRLETQLAETVREHEKAKVLAGEYEEKLAGVRDERKKIKTEALAEAREVLRRAQSLVEDTVKELRAKEAARQTIKEAREKLRRRRDEVARDLERMERAEQEERDEGVRPRELAVGMKVRIAGMGRTGELVELPDGRGKVRVRIKNATVEVSGDDLREAGEGADAPESRRKRVSYTVDVDDAPASELHLLGMRTDEVENAIEKFVGAALLQGLRTVRIVHGKGTGALRGKTHEVLRGLSSVRSFRLGGWGEGDTGVTIVELE